jgi:hypothetical protein
MVVAVPWLVVGLDESVYESATDVKVKVEGSAGVVTLNGLDWME